MPGSPTMVKRFHANCDETTAWDTEASSWCFHTGNSHKTGAAAEKMLDVHSFIRLC
jgi:hypothetical protein